MLAAQADQPAVVDPCALEELEGVGAGREERELQPAVGAVVDQRADVGQRWSVDRAEAHEAMDPHVG